MCCCRSHHPHDESYKFVLSGDEDANSQTLFDPEGKEGELTRIDYNKKGEQNKLEWIVPPRNQHWLFERNYEVHQIVNFIFAEGQQILVVRGPSTIGIDAIIKKAVMYSFDRHKNIESDGIFHIQLDGLNKIGEVISEIANSLNLSSSNPTE